MKVKYLTVCLATFAIACEDDNTQAPPPITGTYDVVEAFPNLSFSRPVDLQHQGDRLFVVEQAGIISVFQNDETATLKKTFRHQG